MDNVIFEKTEVGRLPKSYLEEEKKGSPGLLNGQKYKERNRGKGAVLTIEKEDLGVVRGGEEGKK